MNDLGSLIRTAGRMTVHEDYTENVCTVGEHAALAGARAALTAAMAKAVPFAGCPETTLAIKAEDLRAMLAELGDE